MTNNFWETIWVILFAAGVAQGFFLLFLLAIRHSQNKLATITLSALILAMILGNADFLLTSSLLYRELSAFFGIGMATLVLIGPALYWYSRSILIPERPAAWRIVIHFIPFVALFMYTLPFLTIPPTIKIRIIEGIVAGTLPMRPEDTISLMLQNLHLLGYLTATIWLVVVTRRDALVIPIPKRQQMLLGLSVTSLCFALTSLTILIVVLLSGHASVQASYWFAFIMTIGIYYVALVHARSPELLNPDFTVKNIKYSTFRHLDDTERDAVWKSLAHLLDNVSLLSNPDLNLARVAEHLKSDSQTVSRVIHEVAGKSFPELIGEKRVKEFMSRAQSGQIEKLTIYGLALEVGFNSKSTFNSAFKRVTGITPSAYLEQLAPKSLP